MMGEMTENPVRIRLATSADEASCLALIETLTGRDRTADWGATFRSLVGGERGAIVVAETDAGVLGCATVSYNLAIRYGGEYCQLEELIVDGSARGLSLGRLLIERVIAEARARGCGEFGLYLMPTTLHNEAFYAKFGLETLGPEMRLPLS